MRLLVLLLLCLSSVVLVEGGRRRRRWVSRRRRRWNPAKAIKKVVRCPTKWWKVGGVNLLKYEHCVKFTIYWDNLWGALARPFGNIGKIIKGVVTEMGNFFKDLGRAMKMFFEAVGKGFENAMKSMTGGFLRTMERCLSTIANAMNTLGRKFRDMMKPMNFLKDGKFAEVSSERSSSTASTAGASRKNNICGNDGGASNSLISLWDCGIGRAFTRVSRGPSNINNAMSWVNSCGRFFSDLGNAFARCVTPQKSGSPFATVFSVFPFVSVRGLNLCIFHIFRRDFATIVGQTANKIDRFFKSFGDFVKDLTKKALRAMGISTGFTALANSRSNSGDCQNNAKQSHRNYFGFEFYWDMFPALNGLFTGCFGGAGLLGAIATGFGALLAPLWAITLFMGCFKTDILIIFFRVGGVAGATCGKRWSYGWTCPMWVFAYESNIAEMYIVFTDPKKVLNDLAFVVTMRCCFLPRWGVAWNSNDSQSYVSWATGYIVQLGMCHGPGIKFLISNKLHRQPQFSSMGVWPGHAVAFVICIILGFGANKNCVQTFCFALSNTDFTHSPSDHKPWPCNIMYDLWCGYMDICWGRGNCHDAKDKKYGGRR